MLFSIYCFAFLIDLMLICFLHEVVFLFDLHFKVPYERLVNVFFSVYSNYSNVHQKIKFSVSDIQMLFKTIEKEVAEMLLFLKVDFYLHELLQKCSLV